MKKVSYCCAVYKYENNVDNDYSAALTSRKI